MPSEHNEPPRTPAWPEAAPAWPEVPGPSAFTPPARSNEEPAGGSHPFGWTSAQAQPVSGTDPFGRPPPSGTDPFAQTQDHRPQPQFPEQFQQQQNHRHGQPDRSQAMMPPPPANAADPFGRPQQNGQQGQSGTDPLGRTQPSHNGSDQFGRPQPSQNSADAFGRPQQGQSGTDPLGRTQFSQSGADAFGRPQPNGQQGQSGTDPFGRTQPSQNGSDTFGRPQQNGADQPGRPQDDPFARPRAGGAPFADSTLPPPPPNGAADPFGRSSGTDPFGRSQDPFGRQEDPFGRQEDPFGRSQDPFARPQNGADQFGRPQDDPFARPQDDPFARPNQPFTHAATPPSGGAPFPQEFPGRPQGAQAATPTFADTPILRPSGATNGTANGTAHGAMNGAADATVALPTAAPPMPQQPHRAPGDLSHTGERGLPPMPTMPPMPPGSAPPAGPGGQPDDPYKPFVTAGQISGPKTPPAHRQQELWNTVFGENYQQVDDYADEERAKPVWLFALVGSVLVALIAALLWAFLAGPLASSDEPSSETATGAKPSATKAQSSKPSAPADFLAFPGPTSPNKGRMEDTATGLSVPQLGGRWKTDVDQASIQATYGFTTRQFVSAGTDSAGRPQFAQIMTGALPQSLQAKWNSEDPRPVLNGIVVKARTEWLAQPNKVAKVGQKKVGTIGTVASYKVTDDTATTLVTVAVIDTGAAMPSVVYMAVPESTDVLLPDVPKVFNNIKVG